ncbi:MAG: hypothetical protein CMF96_10255 [Candidatus Marinimicrobia bacterium]|nr:hypothetical protein [Candidatus Neomarinimicrobiota bacterium]
MFRVLTIIKKEFIDLVRDRRTMFFMVIFPAVIIPLLLSGTPKIATIFIKKEIEKTLKVAIVGKENDIELVTFFKEQDKINLYFDITKNQLKDYILKDSLDGGIIISSHIEDTIKNHCQVELKHYFRSGKNKNISESRVEKLLKTYFEQIIENRYNEMNLDKSIFEPYILSKIDVATEQEKFGKTVGTFLPYILLIFCFSGAMYPALDLGSGEKERGTLETILTSPATKIEILFGKFIVVSCFAIMSVIFGLIGILVAVNINSDIPEEIVSVAMRILGIKSIFLILSLLFPVALFFASFLLSISFYANSFKEAQSIMGPLNILIIIPIMIGMMPGITLDISNAWIPILNVSLAMNDIIAGNLSFPLYFEVMGSLLFFTGISIWLSVRFISRESVIFRG